jgi:hypothetical protein
MEEDTSMKECPPDQAEVAREILAYLSGRPGAEDTLEGIMQQRLPENPTSRQTILVKEVVADLVTQGLLEKLRKEDRIVYRLRSRN